MKPSLGSLLCGFILLGCTVMAQDVKVVNVAGERRVDVFIKGKHFTSYCYPADQEKPFLYPVIAPNGTIVTRGYPVAPREGDRVDHPHHIGLWFNHGNVNGIDFWNNSSAIPGNDKGKYGRIVVKKILKAEGGNRGVIEVFSDWVNNSGAVLLNERSTYIFSAVGDLWTIDHISVLSAPIIDIRISDSKEGLFAIRVDRAFEMPSSEPLTFIDSNGKPTEVKVADNRGVTGMYTGSNGKKGDAVWGTTNRWVILNGQKDSVSIGMAIFDNPTNYGFPAYSHARGYGLFAVNNFGRKSYDPSREKLEYIISKGQSVKLVHRFCVKSGSELTAADAEKIYETFINEYK